MADAQRDVIRQYAEMIAAGFGMTADSGERPGDVLPYNPALLQGLAQSGKEMG